MTFEILIKLVDGRVARLSVGNRTAWERRTAKRHWRDCQSMIEDGRRPEWRYATIVPA